MARWRGILPAIVTPFDREGRIDGGAFESHVQRMVDAGVAGLVVNAVTGEGLSLAPAERAECVQLALKVSAGRVPVIASVGSVNDAETLEDIRVAQSAGVDGLMIITPYFYRLSQRERIAYFRRMGRACGLPFIIYNSTYSAAQLDLEALEAIATETPLFVGLKEGNQLQASEVIRRLSTQVAVYTSRDTYIHELGASGGSGAVTYSTNVAPKLTVELWRAVEAENWVQSLALQHMLNPLAWALVVESFPSAIKAVMNELGWRGGYVRPPLSDRSPQDTRSTLMPILRNLEQHFH